MSIVSRVELAFIGIATVLHVGALYGAHLFPNKNLLAEREYAALDLIELEVDEKLQKEENHVEQDRVEQVAAANIDRSDRKDENRSTRQNRGESGSARFPGVDGADTGTGIEPGPGPIDPNDGFSTPEDPGIPGAGGPGREIWRDGKLLPLEKAPAAPTEAPKEKLASRDAANDTIKDVLRKKDKKLGLDLPAAGTVASIIKAQVQGSDAPGAVSAVFTVKLGPGGTVNSVTVGAISGGNASMWNAIASSAKGAIAARKLNLTEDYKKGAVITVNVQSKIVMPSGSEVGAGLKLSLTQNFDVADIGASPVRVITAPYSVAPVK
jgi:hypothetical protein